MLERTYHILFARVLQDDHRFKEMVDAIKRAFLLNPKLSERERNLLKTAYDQVFNEKINLWREFKSSEQYLKDDSLHRPYIKRLVREIEISVNILLIDVYDLADHHLIPNASIAEKFFYYRMINEFTRNTNELIPEQHNNDAVFQNEANIPIAVDERLYSTWLAELHGKRQNYSEMAKAMKNVVLLNANLSEQERELFFCAHNNVLKAKLNSLKKWREKEKILKLKNNEILNEFMARYLADSIDKLSKFVSNIFDLIDLYLLPMAESNSELRVIYLKMKIDFNSYLIEIADELDITNVINASKIMYKHALNEAKNLAENNSIKIEVLNNFEQFKHWRQSIIK